MFKLILEKAEEPEIKLPTSAGSWKKQESSRKTSICFCFIDYAKAFDCVDHNKLEDSEQRTDLCLQRSTHLWCCEKTKELLEGKNRHKKVFRKLSLSFHLDSSFMKAKNI